MKAIFERLSTELMRVLRLVAGAAIAISLFFGGVAWQQSGATSELADADLRGYQRGLSEASMIDESNAKQTEYFAKLLAFVTAQGKSGTLPEGVVEDLSNSFVDAEKGDFESASGKLPQLVELIPDRNCVQSMQAFEAKTNDAFDLCESGSEIVVTRVQLSSGIEGAEVSVDGEEQWQLLGGRYNLKNNCYLTLQRVMETEGQPYVQMRAGC